jgi:hypothetical protein
MTEMADPLDALVLDLVAAVAAAPRPYAEVMEAWRTSCPRLAVWEEATARGLVALRAEGASLLVEPTPEGRAALARRAAAPATPTPPPPPTR